MGFLKKITKPFKKVAKKIVPKELAGIMQVAAPLAGPYAPLVYAAGAYKQSGRINPIALASMALPYVGVAQGAQGAQAGSFGIGNLRYGRFDPSVLGTAGGIKTARDYLGLRGAAEGTLRGRAEDFLFGSPSETVQKEGPFTADQTVTTSIPDTPVIDPLNNINVTDTGSIVNTTTIPGIGPGVATTKATQGILGSAGKFDLTGGKLLSKKDGSLSPTKIATAVTMGLSLSQTQAQIEEEGLEDGLSSSEIARLQAEAEEMWKDFDTTAFKPNVKDGGLMRVNLAMGTKGKPRPGEIFEDSGLEFPVIDSVPPSVGNKAKITAEMMAQEYFGMSFNDLSPTQQQGILNLIGASKPQAKKGGLMRSNFALGTEPTKEESGLGGLPIEADMRYSGGFMPYGAKEKADDVPARLSKNEFVFTADAVRAAGGGSVQKGAQKMYNTMKQLESMGAMV